MYNLYNKGWIEVICGSMFAGKSEELIRRINTLGYAKQKVLIVKPKIDNRYSEDEIASHSGRKVKCLCIEASKELEKYLDKKYDAVAIEEVQFFDDDMVDIVEKFANNGSRVMVAGLDMDYRGKPFGIMPKLLAKAEFVTKLAAVCTRCGAPATRSLRFVDGKPTIEDGETVLVGAKESYTAVCRCCYNELTSK